MSTAEQEALYLKMPHAELAATAAGLIAMIAEMSGRISERRGMDSAHRYSEAAGSVTGEVERCRCGATRGHGTVGAQSACPIDWEATDLAYAAPFAQAAVRGYPSVNTYDCNDMTIRVAMRGDHWRGSPHVWRRALTIAITGSHQ